MPIFDYNFNESDSTLRLISGINICDVSVSVKN